MVENLQKSLSGKYAAYDKQEQRQEVADAIAKTTGYQVQATIHMYRERIISNRKKPPLLLLLRLQSVVAKKTLYTPEKPTSTIKKGAAVSYHEMQTISRHGGVKWGCRSLPRAVRI